MKTKNFMNQLLRTAACATAIIVGANSNTQATTKTATTSGTWNTASIWVPSGVPTASDEVIIISGVIVTISTAQSIDKVTIYSGGRLTWSNSSTLTMSGDMIVSGLLEMKGGNITQTQNGRAFNITNSGTVEWEPGDNTLAGASLFTKSIENFGFNSTLKIKKWYDYANVPLGSVVSGHFGNLYMSSPSNGSNVIEWNQNNQFESHVINGTLYITTGWVTLDKSGSISNTHIGNINILDNSSVFYAHRGTHNGSFTLNTYSINNSGGTFVGLLNGNGNITLYVDGNITNTGNFNVIKNDGVLNVGNGNATFIVTGTVFQLNGDMRIIYNISTINSGIFTATLGNLEFDGGIFMGQYAVHTGAQTCSLTVQNNINAIFASGSEKFRGLGLTTLSGTNNNAKLYFYVGGNLIITSSSNGAEFSTSASTGSEENIINGTFQTSGGQTNIDYGTGQASHNSTLTVNGNMNALSGTLNLSRLDGTTTINVAGNVTVAQGATLSVKGGNGTAFMNIAGNFTQTGGTFNLHANTAVIATSPVTVTVNGDFSQTGGTINFDANGSGLSAVDHFIINGPNFTLGGTASSMTQAGAGTNTVFGYLEFRRKGTTKWMRTNASHLLTQIKILVADGTTLDVYTGNVQIASHTVAGTDFLTVQDGGTLMLRAGQIYSTGAYTYSGMRVESGGTVSTMNLFGFYDGTAFAALKAGFNMNFYLDANSTVEYNGWSNQIITGTGAGVATTTNHKYGKLKVSFNGTTDLNYLYPTSSNVFVRTQLNLSKGEVYLNGYTLTIENGNSDAIVRTQGYIKTESTLAGGGGWLKWKDIASDPHVFPFGKSTYKYIPVTFTPVSRAGGDVLMSTRSTPSNNQPNPLNPINLSAVSLASVDPETDVVDRWWDIRAPGFTADVTVSYVAEENTISALARTGSLQLGQWDNFGWVLVSNVGTGVTSGIGTATISGTQIFSNWMLSSQNNGPLPVSLLDFTATPITNAVSLTWNTAIEQNNDYFTLERSSNGTNFTSIAKVNGAGTSSAVNNYKHVDENPLPGTSYYRLKQTDFDGTTVRLKMVSVNMNGITASAELAVQNVFPNPFKDSFTATINSAAQDKIEVRIMDMNGKVIHSQTIDGEKGINVFEYQANGEIPKGIYFLYITGNGKTVTQKIVKS